ncbi:MAG: right-handed parallel beta-helix repeat-containing protein [Candidatus Angelobacter sp.]
MHKMAGAFLMALAAMIGRGAATEHFVGVASPAARAQTSAPVSDCSAEAKSLPQGTSRVYIALRNGKDGSGSSMADARDGSTVTAFDTILRCYSEGCRDPRNPRGAVAKTENLIVCLGPGTFSTLGTYDLVVNVPHTNPAGFTLGKGWKIHGAGKDKTVVKLSDYLPITDPKNQQVLPVNSGVGLVFGTNSDNASGIEISDLTIDDNYPELKSRARQSGLKALRLDAIRLRSDMGGHWVHDVNVVNAASEMGAINVRWEAFHVWIVAMNQSRPEQNRGNIIENVTMKQPFGNVCTAIVVANATADVRNNLVDGYQIGYGGWDLGETVFHDNTAINTDYGFNIDSLANTGVRIERNKIIHPRKFGFVVGGEGTFANFKFLDNTLQIDKSGVVGFMFRGDVTGAVIAGNKLLADNSSGAHATAFRNYAASRQAGPNHDNIYQSNQIAGGMSLVFQSPSQKSENCFFDNRDERGNPRKDLPDTHGGPCVSIDSRKPKSP